MRIERLPFTVYDIIGYLAPGVTSLWGLLYMFDRLGILGNIQSAVLISDGAYSKALAALMFLITAYLLGQIIGFLASVTVERMCVAYYGYPSSYVCIKYAEAEKVLDWSIKNNMEKFTSSYPGYLPVLRIFLLPIVFFMALLNSTKILDLAIKGLPASIVEMMQKKLRGKNIIRRIGGADD